MLRVLLDAPGELVYQPACKDHLWRDARSWGLFPVGSLLDISPYSVTHRAYESDYGNALAGIQIINDVQMKPLLCFLLSEPLTLKCKLILC